MNIKASEASEQSMQGGFFQAIVDARRRLLLVEYEGIVTSTSLNHEYASPYPGVPDRLVRIVKHCSTHVIVISGHTAHEVARMLGIHTVHEIWGGDGLERLHCDGRYECEELDTPTDALEALVESELLLRCEGLGRFVHVDLASVSVQWRGLSDIDDVLDVRTRACGVLRPLAVKHPSLCLLELEGRVELRLRGATKADSLRRLLSATPAETAIAYIGQDREAFSALNDRDLAFVVRLSPGRAASVPVCPRPADEVIRFLDNWIHKCSNQKLL